MCKWGGKRTRQLEVVNKPSETKDSDGTMSQYAGS